MARSLFSRKNSRRTTAGQADVAIPTEPESEPVTDAEMQESATEEEEPSADGDPIPADSGTEVDEPEGEVEEESATLVTVSQGWRDEIAATARLDSQRADGLAVSLSSAHPGGLAALYAESPTRLSTLVREATALESVARQVRALDKFSQELANRHGRAVLHLAVGSASWGGDRPADDVPVFLRRIEIDGHKDEEITFLLLPGVEISARLLHQAARHGADVDPVHLAEELNGESGFSPAAALTAVRSLGAVIPDFVVKDELSIRLLSHPAGPLYRDLADVEFLAESDLVAALAGEDSSSGNLLAPKVTRVEGDRDPWKEVGVGDQSPQMQDVIESITRGGSYVINPSAGSDPAAAAVSAAAALASDGKSVLLVANSPVVASAVSNQFVQTQVAPIVADFFPQAPARIVQRRLERAMRDPVVNEDASVEETRVALRRARAALTDHEEHLHAEFEQWGVTPFDALQVLTELTSDPDGPSTRVRLSASTLTALSEDGGTRARTLLDEAAHQGLFSDQGEPSIWEDIAIEDSAQVQYVLDAVDALSADFLPAVRVQMARVSGQTGLRPATTLDGWQLQLDLIESARDLLDYFRPEVYDRSPGDLVVSTASSEWRKQKGITIKGSKRRQRVKQARDLLRPGVHVEDLHGALVRVQETRQQWLTASIEGEPWPVIPEGLDHCVSTLKESFADIRKVAPFLAPTFGDLGSMPIDELCTLMEALAADANGARLVPQRLGVLRQLDALGLGELVADLRQRHVGGDLIGMELDLSWWASTLGLMLAAEPRLGGFDPDLLQNLVHEVRELDEAQVQSLGRTVVERVRARSKDSLALYPEQHTALINALAQGSAGPALFGEYSLAWDLLPIVCAGPALVPLLANRRRSVDVLVTVGMQDLPLANVAPVLARATDTLIFATDDERHEKSWIDEVEPLLTSVTLPSEPLPVNSHFADLVVKYKPDASIVALPSPRTRAAVDYKKVEGSGMPAPATMAIESSLAEAELSAELLVQALLENPDDSTVVGTFSERHAERIKSVLRRRLGEDPQAHDVVEARGGVDKIVVQTSQLPNLRPDRTLLSVGFAKTPHGRVIHDFGILSTPEGIGAIEDVALGAAGELTVITTLDSAEIDRSRLRHGGERALVDLLELAEGRLAAIDPAESGEDHVPDDLLIDLADRLHRMGLPVVPNLGTGPYRVPLAIGHPEVPGELLVAVLTDDPRYREERSLRVRDRYWPELLERMGWKVRRALSMAVFIDPNHEADTLVELVLDAVDEHYARIGKPLTPGAAAILAAQGVQVVQEPAQERGASPEAPEPLETHEPDSQPEPELESKPEPVEEIESEAETSPEFEAEVQSETEVEVDEDTNGSEEALFELVGGDAAIQEDAGADVDANAVDNSDDEAREGEEDEERAGVADEEPAAAEPSPVITKGLPLAAYSDDQLDEIVAWLRNQDSEASEEELVDSLREAIGLRRRGTQSDAVLLNVVRRGI